MLVVEDSEITRMLVTGPLRANGMTVHEATHGVEALRLLQTHRVDLVLTDIQMPQMGGLELVERIRARGAHKDVPIVVLSTLGTPEDRTRAMEKGANAYLVKLDFRERDPGGHGPQNAGKRHKRPGKGRFLGAECPAPARARPPLFFWPSPKHPAALIRCAV